MLTTGHRQTVEGLPSIVVKPKDTQIWIWTTWAEFLNNDQKSTPWLSEFKNDRYVQMKSRVCATCLPSQSAWSPSTSGYDLGQTPFYCFCGCYLSDQRDRAFGENRKCDSIAQSFGRVIDQARRDSIHPVATRAHMHIATTLQYRIVAKKLWRTYRPIKRMDLHYHQRCWPRKGTKLRSLYVCASRLL